MALVTDSPVARVRAEALAEHYVAAEIERFPSRTTEKALNPLKNPQNGLTCPLQKRRTQ